MNNITIIDLSDDELIDMLIDQRIELILTYRSLLVNDYQFQDNYHQFNYKKINYYLKDEFFQDEEIRFKKDNNGENLITYPIYIVLLINHDDDSIKMINHHQNEYLIQKYPLKFDLKQPVLFWIR